MKERDSWQRTVRVYKKASETQRHSKFLASLRGINNAPATELQEHWKRTAECIERGYQYLERKKPIKIANHIAFETPTEEERIMYLPSGRVACEPIWETEQREARLRYTNEGKK